MHKCKSADKSKNASALTPLEVVQMVLVVVVSDDERVGSQGVMVENL